MSAGISPPFLFFQLNQSPAPEKTNGAKNNEEDSDCPNGSQRVGVGINPTTQEKNPHYKETDSAVAHAGIGGMTFALTHRAALLLIIPILRFGHWPRTAGTLCSCP